jgi:uncharacterized protein
MIRPALPESFVRSLNERLEALYPGRLRDVLLFGSFARGEAGEHSDVDVMVVLDGEVDRAAESWRLADVHLDLMSQGDRPVELIVISAEEYEAARWPLLWNVREEAISLRTP